MIGKFEEAEEKLEEALEYFKRVPLKERIYASNISGCYNYIGEIQRKQKHFKEAEAYYKQQLQFAGRIIFRVHRLFTAILPGFIRNLEK